MQELILTGYSDGEITPELAKRIDGHLKVCENCRKFKEAVAKMTVDPFKNAQKFTPPDALWEKIRSSVVYEQNRKQRSVFLELHDLLRSVFVIRKPVFAFAAAMVIIVVAALFVRMRFNNEEIAGYLENQIDFIAYLDTDVSLNNADYMNLDVKIEDILSRGNFYGYLYV